MNPEIGFSEPQAVHSSEAVIDGPGFFANAAKGIPWEGLGTAAGAFVGFKKMLSSFEKEK